VGVKILGPDLAELEKIGLELEHAIREVPGTRSVYAERLTTGYFLDFEIRREEAARYGLTVDDVQEIIQSAVGGMNLTTTVEGRGRYPVNVRYPRELRDDPESLKRILVPVMMQNAMASPGTMGASGAVVQVPLGQLADIRLVKGPTVIKSEEGLLASYVFVDFGGRDVGGYVEEAQRKTARLRIPEGYRLEWSGEYEYLVKTEERLKLVIPLTLLLIFILIYLNTRSVQRTLIVLAAVPFSLIGSFWFLYVMGYNLSIAVWVGVIALAGISAETGMVMLLFLDLAYDRWKSEGRMRSLADLREAILHGAVQRLRPKVMTVATNFGLIPILFSTGTGADVMKRIAAPVIGGLFTSLVLVLVLYPVIYMIWRGQELKDP
jgi:Cu(I)/Ag(I) efflux system membrane protein CusA/SilA